MMYSSRCLPTRPILIETVIRLQLTPTNLVKPNHQKMRKKYQNFLPTEFLHADGLTVRDVTNVSATLEWKHKAKNNIHHVKFKACS